jgi:PAS domain S-box-containing protein
MRATYPRPQLLIKPYPTFRGISPSVPKIPQNMQTSAFEVYVLGLLAVLERLPIPIAIAFDRECTRVQGNRAFRRLIGLSTRENVSMFVGVQGDRERFQFFIDGEAAEAGQLPLFRAAGKGADVADIALSLRRQDGVSYDLICSAWPLRDSDGEIEGSIGVFVDITQSREAERRAQQATQALYESEQRYRLITEAMPQFVWLDGPDGSAIYANKRWLEYTGLTEQENFGFGWESVVHPDDKRRLEEERARTLQSGEAYEGECRYRGRDGKYRWFLFRSIPVRDESGEITSWLGTATDIDKQKRAEAQQAFFALASDELSSSLDVGSTLERIARLAIQSLGTWCQIDIPDADGRLRVAVVAHASPGKQRDLEQLVDQHVYDDAAAFGPPAVFRSNKPELLPRVRESAVGAVIPQQRFRDIYRRVGYAGGLMIPLRCGERVLGVLGVASDDASRLYTDFDVATALELGRRGGSALDNAHSYAREHRVASTLQRALLPVTLPQTDELRFDSAYASEAFDRGEAVGGDWYDAFSLGDERIAVSIGDVAGHGVDAAVTMSIVRQAIRAAAIGGQSPIEVLTRANAMIALDRRTPMVTAVYGVYNTLTREFTYAVAGHPRPIVVDDEGMLSELPGGGPPLGDAFDGSLMEQCSITVSAPATIVLYTDGLIEFGHDLLGASQHLRHIVAQRYFLAEEHPAQAIIDMVLDSPQRDDIAVLVMKIDDRSKNEIRITMPAIGRTAPILRERLRQFGLAHDAGEERLFRMLNASGEALANAIEHAYEAGQEAAVTLHAQRAGDRFIVEVSDRGRWRPPQESQAGVRGRGLEIIKSLVDDVAIERTSSGTIVRLTF